MKLIYILNARMPTDKAYGIHVMKMCEALQNAGANVALLYPKRQNSLKEDIFEFYGVEKNFKAKRLFSLDLLMFKFLGHLPYLVSAASFYFFLLFYLLFNLRNYKYVYTRDFYGATVLKLLGKKVIFDVHSLPACPGLLFKFFLKLNDKFIAISEGLKSGLVNFGISAEKVSVLPDGVDLEKFNVSISKEEARKKLGLPQDKRIVMYTGHLYKWKGADSLLGAASKFSKEIMFVFVGGTDKDINEFKEKAEKENLNNFLIVGRKSHNEIPLWLKAADVLVLPNSGQEKLSALYTSPLKMFEYMAAGKPIVASDLPSIKEILNEENSVLVLPDNPEALAQGIKNILENEELAKRISEKTLKDVQKFTWRKRAEKVLEIFKDL